MRIFDQEFNSWEWASYSVIPVNGNGKSLPLTIAATWNKSVPEFTLINYNSYVAKCCCLYMHATRFRRRWCVDRPLNVPPKPRRRKLLAPSSHHARPKLFGGTIQEYVEVCYSLMPCHFQWSLGRCHIYFLAAVPAIVLSIFYAPCGLRGCKNRAHSVSWPEVVKAVPNQGLDCSVS